MEKAKQLDLNQECYEDEFNVPTFKSLGISDLDVPVTYLVGNSLGLMPKSTEGKVLNELTAWKMRGVNGHFDHPFSENWLTIDDPVNKLLPSVLGCEDGECTVMGTLTANLNSLLATFYKPSETRYKILFEDQAFPSDMYAFQSQTKLHGRNPGDTLVYLRPREGEYCLRTEDILTEIEKLGDSLALVIFSGIQYYTGQFFDIPAITKAGHGVGAVVGWDLAHAVGNVPLKLHEWEVDFAVFCTYKYLNSGPGAIGGIFVNSKYSTDIPRQSGWWGNELKTRFLMEREFHPIKGAYGFRQSNPTVLSTVCVGEGLKGIIRHGGMETLRKRSLSLTNYLFELLRKSPYYLKTMDATAVKGFTIITPEDESQRGAQLSLLFTDGIMETVFKYLEQHGVLGDERRPNVIRLAPNHQYNSHQHVYRAVNVLNKALDEI